MKYIKIIQNFIYMKKLYSLFVAMAMVVSVNAQSIVSNILLEENFNTVDGTGGNGTDGGIWSGAVAASSLPSFPNWSVTKAYKGNACLKLGTGSAQGILETPSIVIPELNEGYELIDFILTFRAGAWNGNSENETLLLEISNGSTMDVSQVTLVKGAFTDYTVKITDLVPNSKITFKGFKVNNSRFFIDDIMVVRNSKKSEILSTIDFNSSKTSLVKNTVIADELVFGAVADIKIVNMNGQVVKSAKVSEGTVLNVSALGKGMYIVTGSVNGKTVSQKVIKK